jgi:hypothetical protein
MVFNKANNMSLSVVSLFTLSQLFLEVQFSLVAAQSNGNNSPCTGGTCPFPSSSVEECGLWMGPSPIKSAEDHGFGLGIFTGKAIRAGTPIESTFHGHGELLLPVYASSTIWDDHPPLREYIWEEENMPEVAVEYPDVPTALFIPGIAALAPCTSKNYNLELAGHGTDYDRPRWSAVSDDGGVHRATHPQAGAFSYRHNVTYVAARDIAPGEGTCIILVFVCCWLLLRVFIFLSFHQTGRLKIFRNDFLQS